MSAITRIFQHYNPVKRIVLHVIFWSCMFAMYVILYNRFDQTYSWLLAIKELIAVTSMFYVSSLVIIPKFLLKGRYFLCFVWFVLMYCWWGLLTYLTCLELDLFVHISDRLQKYVDKVLEIGLSGLFKYSTVSFYFLDFIYFISLPLGIKLTQAILNIRYQKTELELKNVGLALNNVELELAFLKAQINPHFLFNTINNIICLIQEDPARAEMSLVQLTGIMNYLVYESDKPIVPLYAEYTFLESYIALEKLRLSNKVQTSIQISSDEDDYFIVPVIIFSFIENAFKHGPMSSSKNAWVDIQIKAKDGKLHMNISNGFKRMSKPVGYVGGVGLDNVKKRLDLNYAGNYILNIQEMEDRYIAKLELNLNVTKFENDIEDVKYKSALQ